MRYFKLIYSDGESNERDVVDFTEAEGKILEN